jgi:predicted dehydrogenase
VRGARGAGTPLAELDIPGKYRWVPDATPRESPYNVAQLYAALGAAIRDDKPAVPGFDAAVTRHRMLDMITQASETGQTQTA